MNPSSRDVFVQFSSTPTGYEFRDGIDPLAAIAVKYIIQG